MDGIIIVNKPSGITSFRVVQIIRKLTGVRRVGHTGTLDPSATGLLIVCLGKACKMVSSLMAHDKDYEAEITFGITTDSGDRDGKILTQNHAHVSKEQLEKVLDEFKGDIEQIPPMVSAIHHKGERLYDIARRGITVERPARKVHINDIRLLSFEDGDPPKANIYVSCSKGTYIRTLCEDIGKKLGCGAFESSLKRVKMEKVDISQSRTLEELTDLFKQGRFHEALLNDIQN